MKGHRRQMVTSYTSIRDLLCGHALIGCDAVDAGKQTCAAVSVVDGLSFGVERPAGRNRCPLVTAGTVLLDEKQLLVIVGAHFSSFPAYAAAFFTRSNLAPPVSPIWLVLLFQNCYVCVTSWFGLRHQILGLASRTSMTVVRYGVGRPKLRYLAMV